MVDIVEISAIVAAAGVLIGVVYYIFDMRQQTKIRQTDLIIRLYSYIASKEFLEAWETIKNREITNPPEYRKKHGDTIHINLITTVLGELGMLLRRKLLDITLIDDVVGHTNVFAVYEKLKPFMEYRKRMGGGFESIDYLYNELKKREQQFASKTS